MVNRITDETQTPDLASGLRPSAPSAQPRRPRVRVRRAQWLAWLDKLLNERTNTFSSRFCKMWLQASLAARTSKTMLTPLTSRQIIAKADPFRAHVSEFFTFHRNPPTPKPPLAPPLTPTSMRTSAVGLYSFGLRTMGFSVCLNRILSWRQDEAMREFTSEPL